MKMFIDINQVYLHRTPVDFRKAINGLSLIVESDMTLPVFSGALFVFCNKKRDKLKLLYWDKTGFALWYKRLEKEKFKWPRKHNDNTIELTEEQLHWLLEGVDITKHTPLNYQTLL
ncbi:MAG: IS66 family insertion sequence element accessory protein TnpB [Gammaproteobacteria bacterium]|nr:MAG: IS66 family insertion sequence element accessory protein TnpB [Gammaproteobacteria bacterium]